jgi:hypothetical protein
MEIMQLNREEKFIVPKVFTKEYKLLFVECFLSAIPMSFIFSKIAPSYALLGCGVPVLIALVLYLVVKLNNTRVELSKQGVLISKKEKSLVDEKWEDLEYASLCFEQIARQTDWKLKFRNKTGWTEDLSVAYYNIRTLVGAVNFYAGKEMFKEDELLSFEKRRKEQFMLLLFMSVMSLVGLIVVGFVLEPKLGQ